MNLILAALLISSCVYQRPTSTPILATGYPAPDSSGISLVIFFPGYRDKIEAFQRHGFIQLLNHYYPQADSVVIDSHIAYFEDQTLVIRIYEDIISPAIENGYQKIILVGVSLGGLGALWTSYELRDHIDSIVLFAPYLAGADAEREIENYGSINAWVRTFDGLPNKNQQVWYWINSLLVEEKFKQSIILAYGRNDRLASLADLLAGELPISNVMTNEGSHKWKDWAQLWEMVLSQKAL